MLLQSKLIVLVTVIIALESQREQIRSGCCLLVIYFGLVTVIAYNNLPFRQRQDYLVGVSGVSLEATAPTVVAADYRKDNREIVLRLKQGGWVF
jgi:hypothetical protein